jgi:hypothetical protein
LTHHLKRLKYNIDESTESWKTSVFLSRAQLALKKPPPPQPQAVTEFHRRSPPSWMQFCRQKRNLAVLSNFQSPTVMRNLRFSSNRKRRRYPQFHTHSQTHLPLSSSSLSVEHLSFLAKSAPECGAARSATLKSTIEEQPNQTRKPI